MKIYNPFGWVIYKVQGQSNHIRISLLVLTELLLFISAVLSFYFSQLLYEILGITLSIFLYICHKYVFNVC